AGELAQTDPYFSPGRSRIHSAHRKVYILDRRIATPVPRPSRRTRRLLMHGAVAVEMVALDLAIERRQVNPQHLRGLHLVVFDLVEHALYMLALELLERESRALDTRHHRRRAA